MTHLRPSGILNDENLATYICTECEAIFDKKMEICPKCKAAGAIDRIEVTPKLYDEDFGLYDKCQFECEINKGVSAAHEVSVPKPEEPPAAFNDAGEGLSDLNISSCRSCGVTGFDSLFGGGPVAGTFHLFVGAQSCGKTSFLLKIAEGYAMSGRRTLYISSEESKYQMSDRLRRMNINSPVLFTSQAGDMDLVMSEIASHRPEIVFLDSMSGFFKKQVDAMCSSNIQIRECIAELARMAKEKNITVFAAANDTSPSTMREFNSISHFFDSVISFEAPFNNVKLARVLKSRDSRRGTVAVFRSDHNGLTPSPADEYEGILSGALENGTEGYRIGAVSCCYRECGVLIFNELETIVGGFQAAAPQWNVCRGLRRDVFESVAMIVEKYNAVSLHDKNIIARLKGPSHAACGDLELAIAAALVSSCCDIAVSNRALFIGGLDYGGSVSPADVDAEMLCSLINSGFKTVISSNLKKETFQNLSGEVSFYNIQNIKYLRELLSSLSLEAEKTNG